MPSIPLYSAIVQADGATILFTNPDEFAELPTVTLAGFTLTEPGSPTFPATELLYDISPSVYSGQMLPDAVIDGESVAVINDSALLASEEVAGSQGLNGLNSTLANRAAYVGATTGSGSTSGGTLSSVPTGAPEEGAVLFANATLGEEPRKFTRNGTAIAVTPVLPSGPSTGTPVVMGNK